MEEKRDNHKYIYKVINTKTEGGDGEENLPDFLKIDVVDFILAILKKSYIAVIVAFCFGLFVFLTGENDWEVTCLLIRREKQINQAIQIPYFFEESDLPTLMKTIKSNKNRLSVKDRLNLNDSKKAEEVLKKIRVNEIAETDIIKLIASGTDRAMLVSLVNTLADVFIEGYIEQQKQVPAKTLQHYLEKRDEVLREIKSAEREINNFNKKYGLSSLESETDATYREIENLRLQKFQKEVDILSIKNKDEKKLSELKEELEKLSQKYTQDNIRIINVKEEIAYLESKIKDANISLELLRSNTNSQSPTRYKQEIDVTRKQIDIIENLINKNRSQLKYYAEISKELMEIKDTLNLLRDKLDSINRVINQTEALVNAELGDISVLEYAIMPIDPSPSKKAKAIVAFIVGGFLGGLLLLCMEFFNFTVKSPFDYEHIFKIKLISRIIPYSKKKRKTKRRRDFFSNIHLLSNYIYESSSQSPEIITVGSVGKKRGKSFITRQIIRVLVASGKRVLYIKSRPSKSEKDGDRFLINRELYEGEVGFEVREVKEGLYRADFLVDGSIYNRLLPCREIRERLKALEDYDFIFWELFIPEVNSQLFNNITLSSDIFLMVAQVRKSGKFKVKKQITDLKGLKEMNGYETDIIGVLNYGKS